MKIVIDYFSQLDEETKSYRDNIIKLLSKKSGIKLYVLYKGKKPKISNVIAIRKGLDHIKPDAVVVFDLVSKKIYSEYDTYIYVDNLIKVRADGKIDRIAKKLIEQFEEYRGIFVRTGYLKLYLSNHYGINKNKILVTSQGFDERFKEENIAKELRDVRRTLTQYGIAKPYIFMFGRLQENINVEGVFEAFAKIHLKFPDLKLLIASPDFKIGWDNKPQPLNKRAEAILELCNTYKINRKVIFTGFIDRDHLPLVISNAEMCLIIHENPKFSRSLTEAMATGVPIIISDSPVLKEIAANSTMVANPKVVDSLSDTMALILNEEAERDRLKLKTIARAGNFDWERTTAKVFEFIEFNHKNRAKPELLYITNTTRTAEENDEKLSLLAHFYKVTAIKAYNDIKISNYKKYRYIYIEKINFSFSSLFIVFLKLINKRVQIIGELGENFIVPKNFRKLLFILYMRLSFDHIVVDNPVLKVKLVKKLHISPKKIDEIPVYLPQEAAKIDNSKFKLKYKLKNYIPITMVVDSLEEFEQLKLISKNILENMKEAKIMMISDLPNLSFKDISDNIAKKIFVLKKEKKTESLLNSRICVDLRKNITQKEILFAMKSKNILLVSRNNNSRYLVKEGINGYIFNDGEFSKVSTQVATLMGNKKHLSDIQKINTLKSAYFSKDNTLDTYKLVIKNW